MPSAGIRPRPFIFGQSKYLMPCANAGRLLLKLRRELMKSSHEIATFLFKVCLLMACTATAWSSSAYADSSSLPYSGGGPLAPVLQAIAHYNQTGEKVRIEGQCRSSCTMLLAIRNVCVEPSAVLMFHTAPTIEATNRMASAYNARLRKFLLANHYLDTEQFHPISGSDIIKFGYRPCR
jgi:hypothetical protein